MATKNVVIEFDDDGNCIIDGHIGGPECDRIIGELERLLGVTTRRDYKLEYRHVERGKQQAR